MKSLMNRCLMMVFVMGGVLFLSSGAYAFNCGKGIVSIGDAKSRVMIECGKPTYKERVGANDVYSADASRRRTRSSKKVEQWTYNCGEGDYIYVLTFEGGKLVKEETNGFGKGKSRCR
ncbi:MAG: DUF2845 domain-containing protein [Syntrophales bacterium]|nr:DUF2845 domain-containing protein [Syntrophales bacterium]